MLFFIAFDEGERKPNFALWFLIAGVLCTVIGRKIHIPVRLQKCAPRLNFAGACLGREAGTIRSQETFFGMKRVRGVKALQG